jgi:hypothetical protein
MKIVDFIQLNVHYMYAWPSTVSVLNYIVERHSSVYIHIIIYRLNLLPAVSIDGKTHFFPLL